MLHQTPQHLRPRPLWHPPLRDVAPPDVGCDRWLYAPTTSASPRPPLLTVAPGALALDRSKIEEDARYDGK
jgi:hypothetical protein